MAQTITTGYKALLSQAEAKVQSLSPLESQNLAAAGNALIVDIRDPREIEREGKIPGSFHAPRGMLEFWVDPESPYFKPVFAEERPFVLHCAGGWRSLLAAETLRKMGLKPVFNLTGGFAAWKQAGLPVEGGPEKPSP